ncbi:MAG TPA: hypothetical protein VF588_06955 [Pyrinomonadaceae bacterium]|jgi:hypothetical protein
MIEERANYYQRSYKAPGAPVPLCLSVKNIFGGRFTREKALRDCFTCDTVPPNRGATPEVPEEFSAGQALKERPPSKHFQAGTGF